MYKPKSLYDVDDEEAPQKKKIIKKKCIKCSEKHPCFGINQKGESCKVVGTEQYTSGNWYCWRHFPDADEFEEVRKKNNIPHYTKIDSDNNSSESDSEEIEFKCEISREICLENCKKLLLELEKTLMS